MPRLLNIVIPLILLFSSFPAESSTPPAEKSNQQEALETGQQDAPALFAQRGFLDNGQLLSGQAENWKEVIDTLSRLRFNYIATANAEADATVSEYLEDRGLTIRNINYQDEAADKPGKEHSLVVIGENSQKLWNGGMLELPENSKLLWADDGSGKLDSGPFDKKGHDFGVFLHAGSPQNGPVQDPYPGLLGDSIKAAIKRGLTANVLIAAPDVETFILNLEASSGALKQMGEFDGDAFYLDWATQNFGTKAAATTVKSLKLLHGAHTHVRGFADISKNTAEILAGLAEDKTGNIDLNPISDAIRLSRRSLELAQDATKKVPADKSKKFESQILFPAKIFAQNLELLESLSQLSNAWKIYRLFPPNEVSRQRVTGLLAEAQGKAENLQATLANGPGGEGFKNPENWVPKPESIEALTNKL